MPDPFRTREDLLKKKKKKKKKRGGSLPSANVYASNAQKIFLTLPTLSW